MALGGPAHGIATKTSGVSIGGARNAPRSIFFQFHAVFGKQWPK